MLNHAAITPASLRAGTGTPPPVAAVLSAVFSAPTLVHAALLVCLAASDVMSGDLMVASGSAVYSASVTMA